MSKPMEEINNYKCPKCKRVIERRCSKEWMKSFCKVGYCMDNGNKHI